MKAVIFYNNSLEYTYDKFEIESIEEFSDSIKEISMPTSHGFISLIDINGIRHLINTRFIQSIAFEE